MKALIFVCVLTLGGSAAALFNPFVGLLVYVSLAILRPYSLWAGRIPVMNYSQIVAIALLVGWAAKGFGSWRFGRAWAIVAALVSYGLWMMLTTLSAVDQRAAWSIVDITVKIIVPFVVGMTTIDSVRKIKQLAWAIVLSEGYVAYELNMTYLAGYNRLWLEGFGSLDNNGAAAAMVPCTGVTVFLILYTADWKWKILAAGCALFMVHAILFSFSRGGMVSLIITCFVAFLLIPKKPVHYAGAVLTLLVVLRLAGPQVVDRFEQSFVTEKGEDASADSRLEQWAACKASLMASPLGLGPDQWKYHSEEFGLPKGQAAHSTWLQVGVEMGLPGLAFLLLFYGTVLLRLRRLIRKEIAVDDPWSSHLARMVTASLIGYMIAAQFVTLHLLEIPYYVNLIGACLLKIESTTPALLGTPLDGEGPEFADATG